MVYGFLHCHSHHSQMDSTTKIDELCKTAKEMGAQAISLTDHGVCTGHIEFMDACKKYGLNGIPGVEAYLDTGICRECPFIITATKLYRLSGTLPCSDGIK